MPRNGSTIPADLIGKLEWLRVECQKCGVSTMPTDLMLTTWLSDLTGDCPRRNTHANWYDPCRACCPDLPKFV
jgi:hypothetical protein